MCTMVEDKADAAEMRRKNSIDDSIKRTIRVVDAEQEVNITIVVRIMERDDYQSECIPSVSQCALRCQCNGRIATNLPVSRS